ncbi:UDP-N-acetylglucosamine-N-acetylmuramyl-(pentapeptide) pyrophosphoryl-undecaprenol N-acetylglucosamine transferase [Cutibacterium acnes JCM 18916]|nr:UDP-N-acetylglucosamine-N-acetylmuramyl-(pentapeptide) pyrophosphoryl-undecaprenol N-acetylglucosamine transferase [Cutibacterium acnes JCM 18916]GAE75506.1 UDP-N-acetylglucosamine-N-acetylmuramyl-(pentapeptide) pyrophosphoryl-undecaprenol N-acetylglucosamine transferase [Cutibacterium acnes JCM 18918]
MVNVVLAGGGTAGHTSPLIATAMALQERGATVSCIGTPRGLEGRVIPEAGLQLDMIPPVPLPRTVNADLFKVPARLAGAVRKAGEVLQRRQTDVVVGFGGYVSLPAYLAARRAKIPVVIHEQNAVPGLANKIAARFAVFVGTAFPDTPLPKARFVGMPLRSQITDLADASGQARAERCARARADLGLDINRPTLLVSGGSQGAVAINEAVVAARTRLLADGVQILHVLGPKNIRGATRITDELTGASWLPMGYVDDMASAYAAADLMVARSGAGTVVETATVGLRLSMCRCRTVMASRRAMPPRRSTPELALSSLMLIWTLSASLRRLPASMMLMFLPRCQRQDGDSCPLTLLRRWRSG